MGLNVNMTDNFTVCVRLFRIRQCVLKSGSRLDRPLAIEGSTLFTASGTQYFHVFNMSLCGGARATCHNNVSYHEDGGDRGTEVGDQFGPLWLALTITERKSQERVVRVNWSVNDSSRCVLSQYLTHSIPPLT